MSFAAAEENFHSGSQEGIAAKIFWPGIGEVPATELVLRHLLPLAHRGLEEWGVATADKDRLLGVIEGRCLREVNGASWQAATFHRFFDSHDRHDALREMMRSYVGHMHSNEPVHTWPAA